MQKEILAEYLEEALTGDQPFCWEYLTKITGSNLHLMSGNRCFQTPSKLSSFLFDFNDERKRLRWEDRPFRKLYQRARTGLSLRHGRQMGQRFFRQLLQNLFKYHWILPYPREDRWVYRIKKGKRLWYSIEKDDEGGGDAASHGWEWAKQSYQEGYPNEIPRYVSWTKEEWESWLLRNGGEVGGVVLKLEGLMLKLEVLMLKLEVLMLKLEVLMLKLEVLMLKLEVLMLKLEVLMLKTRK